MKLDLRQISAGIALAGMTQAELAAAAGLEAASLSRILKGEVTPRPESLDRIKIALEARQIEFGPRSSVALRDDYVRRIEGEDRYIKLHKEILRFMLGTQEEVLFFMIDPGISPPEIVEAFGWLHDAGVKCRYLCRENPTRLDGPPEQYRVVPDKYFVNQVQVIYGHHVAQNSKTPLDNILIINSPSLAAVETAKFNYMWDHSEPPKVNIDKHDSSILARSVPAGTS